MRNTHSLGQCNGGSASERSSTLMVRTILQGTTFPHPITSAASVQYDNTMLVVGGFIGGFKYSDEIYKYDPSKELWEKLNVTLQTPDSGLVAFMVPKSIFPPCTVTTDISIFKEPM